MRVKNGRFELRGKPYYYVGANMWFGGYVGDATLEGGRKRLVRELDQLQKLGATNVRIPRPVRAWICSVFQNPASANVTVTGSLAPAWASSRSVTSTRPCRVLRSLPPPTL